MAKPVNPNGGAPSPEEIRRNARDTLKKLETKLSKYSNLVGDSLHAQMARNFAYLSNALDDDTTATTMVKDAVALMIENCQDSHDFYSAAYKIWFPV